jgi:hypothetical protein
VSARMVWLVVPAVVAGVLALGLAHDVRAWEHGLDQGDSTYAARPQTAQWGASTWLFDGSARRILGIGDDLALRRAEQAFSIATLAHRGLDNGARRAQLRASAELALTDVVTSGSAVQASRAGNLLGILAATAADQTDSSEVERRAGDLFDAAIRTDPTNVAAKANLELLLRRIHVVGVREGPSNGSGNRGDSLEGAGAGEPGSGY